MSDPFIKNSLADYTENEFVKFLEEIFREDVAPTGERADVLVLHFNKIVGHPSKMNLIYRPEPGADTSAEGITKTIKEWREANGLPGFKPRF
ncbi:MULTISPECIES: bacteriocin immunity protein [unclassified Pseudomonas]|uniref:bacteriocin immunity protein n=1 Tax=unclassified Pseudomonas TaxID=196821 RepID=UPI002AC8F91B|nr:MULTISPECIES: bacteriocin immunity protein [unclassified Pseudomonas]MEB0048095.1 bacteriocin immunity protein [Pseudomonas sp. Dout3]MEB0098237.1 bacteriocin immunity protein [Pseudomonas sp. DC1.2]WPX59195.1 bacteriocin immunity protein [Pseudomonas sp. DC1.2]